MISGPREKALHRQAIIPKETPLFYLPIKKTPKKQKKRTPIGILAPSNETLSAPKPSKT
jgi:hypothetical protein